VTQLIPGRDNLPELDKIPFGITKENNTTTGDLLAESVIGWGSPHRHDSQGNMIKTIMRIPSPTLGA
jgi:hypothetical protein